MAIKLSTGKIAFPIEFDGEESAVIYFNPNDPNLSIRMKDFEQNMRAKLEMLEKDFSLDAEGNPKEPERIEDFRKVQNALFEEIDKAFDSEISDVVFKHCSPFAVVGGDLFIMQFLEAIKPEVQRHVEKGRKTIEKKLQKHVEKYMK